MTVRRKRLLLSDPVHAHGERTPVERYSLRQALAWTIAAELVRRHPAGARVVETHPGGGQYDCITVIARATCEDADWPGGWRTIVDMNKADGGHLTQHGWFTDDPKSDRFNWLETLLCADVRSSVVEQLEVAEGWASPEQTPATSDASIGVRVLAAFAQRVAFSRKPWTLISGHLDTSGYGGGPRDELFVNLPTLDEHRRQVRPDDPCQIPEYRYWFVTEDRQDSEIGSVRLAVDTADGVAFTASGPVRLMSEYTRCGRKIDAVVSSLCPPAF